jgi:hypothetical protein
MVKGIARTMWQPVGWVLVGVSISLAHRWRTGSDTVAVAANGSGGAGASPVRVTGDASNMIGLVDSHMSRATDDDVVLERYRTLMREARAFVTSAMFMLGLGLAAAVRAGGAPWGAVVGAGMAGGGALTVWLGALAKRRLEAWRPGRGLISAEPAPETLRREG